MDWREIFIKRFAQLDDDDTEEPDYSNLKTVNELKSIYPRLISAAQKIYDEWDEELYDEYAGGGICHIIADEFAGILNSFGYEATTVSQQIGEVHVYCIFKAQEGVFTLDISPYSYESGGGYSWTKNPDVIFDESYLELYKITNDPSEFEDYIDS